MVETVEQVRVQRPISYMPRPLAATQQDSLPVRYSIAVQVLSMAAFTWAFSGWLNEAWLKYFDNPFWLNRYTEYAVILVFGLWRIRAEVNPYTRRRLMILVTAVSVLWWGVPLLAHLAEPHVGDPWRASVFPSVHVLGTLTFLLMLVAVLLVGRQVICGFNCPYVGIRENGG